jgi:acetamidase/formamidase
MFGCSEHWIGKRFSHALTAFLAEEKRQRELRAHDALDASALAERDEGWRALRASALELGRAADAFALADTPLPDATAASPTTAGASDNAGTGGNAGFAWTSTTAPVPLGRTHIVPSNAQTVILGLLDPTRAPLFAVDSGDVLVYENTWTHFLNRLQPGVSADELTALRKSLAGRGVHSIIGPIAVNGARPGDVLQLRMLRLETIDFGANFHNPGALQTGALPDEFTHGHVHYFTLSPEQHYVEFSDRIRLEMKPFQGTIGVAPAGDEAISSVAPGKFGGNIDLKELTAGSSLFVPVQQPGALIYTGDSHALQGDGEVNITAIETAMREVRLQVILHQNAGWSWPFAETPTHWIALGTDPSLNEALRIALRGTIDFLHLKAGLSRDEAYSLASLAVDFRITQMVDVNNGVHAMIPKSIFAEDYRRTIALA